MWPSYSYNSRVIQSCRTQWKAMSSAGMSLFQRPLIVYQCGIYRQLAVVRGKNTLRNADCGMQNVDHAYFAECEMRKKLAE